MTNEKDKTKSLDVSFTHYSPSLIRAQRPHLIRSVSKDCGMCVYKDINNQFPVFKQWERQNVQISANDHKSDAVCWRNSRAICHFAVTSMRFLSELSRDESEGKISLNAALHILSPHGMCPSLVKKREVFKSRLK